MRLFLCLVLISGIPILAWAEERAESLSHFSDACNRTEAWAFGAQIEDIWKAGYAEYLAHRMSPLRGFSEAMALRAQAKSEESRVFGEYWASRALLDANLPHIAYSGFSSIVGRETALETQAVQLAALQCLLEIQKKIPSLSLSSGVSQRILNLPSHPIVWEAAALLLRERLASGASPPEMERILKVMSGGGAQLLFASAIYSASRERHSETIASLTQFFQDPGYSTLKRYADAAHLLLARAYFATKQYDAASAELKMIKKTSNELSHGLSELAWAHLRGEKYQDAVGIATNLQSGGLKDTFAPESYMVMAMAFNELCYFPESLKAMKHLKDSYATTYDWLEAWEKTFKSTHSGGNLYALALARLKRTGQVPAKIANEWIRSPLFFSRQEEINAIFEQRRAIVTLGDSGSRELRKRAVDLLRLVHEIKPMYLRVKSETLAGQDLPETMEQELTKLRKAVTSYRRLKRGAGPWKRILAFFQTSSPSRQKQLVSEMNEDLTRMNQRMLVQLAEVADNTHFIEVEIFNGASQDMVWQNAHPDFGEVSKGIHDEANRRPSGAGVWDWGNVSGGVAGTQEIWEDEMGSFRAELQDNCTNRERYLTIKKSDKAALRGRE